MKWYYYYHHMTHTKYSVHLFTMSTKLVVYWRNLCNDHITGVKQKFPGAYQPNKRLYYKILLKMDRWLLLFQRELDRRKDDEYRAFVSKIIHKPQEKITASLILADWCQERGMYVYARQMRKWAEGETKILQTLRERSERDRKRNIPRDLLRLPIL